VIDYETIDRGLAILGDTLEYISAQIEREGKSTFFDEIKRYIHEKTA
jgi:hypothetical protein